MRKFLKSGFFLGNFRIINEKCLISEIWKLRISAKNEFRDLDFQPMGLRIGSGRRKTGSAEVESMLFRLSSRIQEMLRKFDFSDSVYSISELLRQRVFSQLKLIKTDHRNRLDSVSCSSLLKVNFGLNSLDALRPL